MHANVTATPTETLFDTGFVQGAGVGGRHGALRSGDLLATAAVNAAWDRMGERHNKLPDSFLNIHENSVLEQMRLALCETLETVQLNVQASTLVILFPCFMSISRISTAPSLRISFMAGLTLSLFETRLLNQRH